jgi:hypothetical protein
MTVPQPRYSLAASDRVRSTFLTQRREIERAWGRISKMSDQDAPGHLIVRTDRGYVLLLGLAGTELWVDVLRKPA